MTDLRRALRRERRARLRAAPEQGFVTAETAMVLPSLFVLGLALVAVVIGAATQLRCSDAAWEAARALARGESPDYVTDVVNRFGPAGASMFVDTRDGSVLVRVSKRLALGSTLLPVIRIEGHAQIACELATPCSRTALESGVR